MTGFFVLLTFSTQTVTGLVIVSFCSHHSVANNGKDPVIRCLFVLWPSVCTLSTLKSCSFCYFFSFWQKLCSFLIAAVQLQASLTYYRFFLQDLILFWHSSIQKSIVDLCFHCEHAVHFRGSWIRISLSFRFATTRRMECDCRFLWLSETFSKNFSEITLDRHLDLKLYELYIFWMLIWSIILLFFCSFATEIKIPNLYFEKL